MPFIGFNPFSLSIRLMTPLVCLPPNDNPGTLLTPPPKSEKPLFCPSPPPAIWERPPNIKLSNVEGLADCALLLPFEFHGIWIGFISLSPVSSFCMPFGLLPCMSSCILSCTLVCIEFWIVLIMSFCMSFRSGMLGFNSPLDDWCTICACNGETLRPLTLILVVNWFIIACNLSWDRLPTLLA